MISLVSLRTGAMERMIKKAANLDNASGLMNCLFDWTDADDLTRINGAESFYYRAQGLPYAPRNYALQYKEEVGFVKGFEKDLYGKLQPYLTMLPSTGFNPNTASDAVLMAYLDINEESLKTLKEFMSQKAILSNTELFALTGRWLGGEDDFYPSTFVEITVRAGAPKTIYSIRTGLNVTQNTYSPYSVVYWSEE
jgi:general secretion pathway protein K